MMDKSPPKAKENYNQTQNYQNRKGHKNQIYLCKALFKLHLKKKKKKTPSVMKTAVEVTSVNILPTKGSRGVCLFVCMMGRRKIPTE